MNLAEIASPHEVSTYFIHVTTGTAVLALAAIALSSKKGGTTHVYAGRLFVVLSTLAAVTALLFLRDFGFVHNIFGTAALAISVVASSFLALRKPSSPVKTGEIVCLLTTFVVALMLFSRFVRFSLEDGLLSGSAAFTFLCASFPLFWTIYDAYFITRDEQTRKQLRIRRHVTGMAFVCAVMVHAPIVSVFTELQINFWLKFFGPYAAWPIICYFYLSHMNHRVSNVEACEPLQPSEYAKQGGT